MKILENKLVAEFYLTPMKARQMAEWHLADRKAILDRITEPLKIARKTITEFPQGVMDEININTEAIKESLNLADEITKG